MMKRAGLLMSVVAAIGDTVAPSLAGLRRQGYNVRVQKKSNPEVEAAAQAKRERKAAKRRKE